MRLLHAKLVGDIAHPRNLRHKIFDHAFLVSAADGARKRDLTSGNLDFDLGRIDFMVAREKVTDLFFDPLVRTLVTFRSAAGLAFRRRFAAPARLALVVVPLA
jgi:hypothetical protein